jgi:hypothetical protein
MQATASAGVRCKHDLGIGDYPDAQKRSPYSRVNDASSDRGVD